MNGEDLICQALTQICSDTLLTELSKAYILQCHTLKKFGGRHVYLFGCGV
jgi:hypothetical protein